ncbi:AbrB/MazE/SpoVT family DNA-binding domain-containing protein [Candidatus Woesearchaeota archaeon]|nr:AbrB/MazE/SpoVT family DNA-binding domain-containing protein [Candidatus Woesearchaeota archaeon]
METISKTRKIGGSLMVTIPREIVEEEGLVENQTVKIEIRKLAKSGFGLCKGMGSFSKESKLRGQLE